MHKAYYLFLLFTISGCLTLAKKPSIDSISIDEIFQNRSQALSSKIREYKFYEYKLLKRKCYKILKALADTLHQNNTYFKTDTLNIIDTYVRWANYHGGVIWGGDKVILYGFNFSSNKIYYYQSLASTSEYPENADIDLKLFNFLTNLKEFKDLDNMPATSRSNNGYCVFTRIIKDTNIKIESCAFRQW